MSEAIKKKAHALSVQFYNRKTRCPQPNIALACEKMAAWVLEREKHERDLLESNNKFKLEEKDKVIKELESEIERLNSKREGFE